MEEENRQSGQPETETVKKHWYSGIQNWFLSWTGKKREKSEQSKKSRNQRNEALMNQLGPDVDEKTREYIKSRVIEQMDYYSSKSRQYHQTYQNFMTATIILGGAIPVCSILDVNHSWVNVLVAILGASVTGINAYLATTGYRDLWIKYRTTRETLLRTLYCYINNAGKFEQDEQNNMTQEQKNILLVNTCEEILSHENGSWEQIIQSSVTQSRISDK